MIFLSEAFLDVGEAIRARFATNCMKQIVIPQKCYNRLLPLSIALCACLVPRAVPRDIRMQHIAIQLSDCAPAVDSPSIPNKEGSRQPPGNGQGPGSGNLLA